MADKKTYYKLDDIGFLGTQEKISNTRKKADAKKTAEIIDAGKTRKNFPIRKTIRDKVAR